MNMDGRIISILGKRWRLVYSSLRGDNGECDPPDAKGKSIRIAKYLRRHPRALAETIIHEILHAADWWKDEVWIEQLCEDIVRVLDKEELLKT
jgi:hypothetical protein